MKKTDLKKLLAYEFQMQSELIDLCKEMLEEIFLDSRFITHLFESDIEEGIEYNGCLQSLQYYRNQFEKHNERLGKEPLVNSLDKNQD